MWQFSHLFIIFTIKGFSAHPANLELDQLSETNLNLNLFFNDCDGSNMIFESHSPVIESKFMKDPELTCLNLENRGIVEISSKAFIDLPNLEYLNLANNNLSKEHFLSSGKHEKLKILVLDRGILGGYQNLTGFPRYLKVLELKGHFPNLERLYLRNNSIAIISTIPGKILLPKLTHLFLNGNELTNESPYFDRSFSWLPKSLKSVHLENNDINFINLGNYHDLEFISVDNNRISDITLWNIPKLKYFSGVNNDISWFSDFRDSPELRVLNLSNNRIRYLNHIHHVPSLYFLLLDNNLLHSIPRIKSIPCIKILSLSCNEIKSLGSRDFISMKSLEYLYLDHNQIAYINKKSFENLENLKLLSLEQNKLTYISLGWMINLRNLRELNLKGNLFLNIYSFGLTTNHRSDLHIVLENYLEGAFPLIKSFGRNVSFDFNTESSVKICEKHVSEPIHSFDWTYFHKR